MRRSGRSAEALSSASSKRRRLRSFISACGRPSLHAATSYQRAAKYSCQNLPRHTCSLAQVITAMNGPSERLRTPRYLGGGRRGGMVAVARNGKDCTRRELVANGFAWRPLPRAFKFTRFVIQPTRKKHTDRVFLSSSCEPLDSTCEPLDQAHFHQSGRSTRIVCLFQVLVS